jgi:hypothetical protein
MRSLWLFGFTALKQSIVNRYFVDQKWSARFVDLLTVSQIVDVAQDVPRRKQGRQPIFSPEAEQKLGVYLNTAAHLKMGLNRKLMFKEVHALQKELSKYTVLGQNKTKPFQRKQNLRSASKKVDAPYEYFRHL